MDSLTSSLSQDINDNNNENLKILQNKIKLSAATVNTVIKSKRLFVNKSEIIDSTTITKSSNKRNHLLSKRKLVRLTCEGNLNDTNFPNKLRTIITKLKIILLNGKNLIKVTKVEPWNSVRVTLNLSDDAAQQLRQLAEHGDSTLRNIGILSVQVDGQQVISLTNTSDVNRNNNVTATSNTCMIDSNQNDAFTIENHIGREKDSHLVIPPVKNDNNYFEHTNDRINGITLPTTTIECENSNSSTSIHSGGGGANGSSSNNETILSILPPPLPSSTTTTNVPMIIPKLPTSKTASTIPIISSTSSFTNSSQFGINTDNNSNNSQHPIHHYQQQQPIKFNFIIDNNNGSQNTSESQFINNNDEQVTNQTVTLPTTGVQQSPIGPRQLLLNRQPSASTLMTRMVSMDQSSSNSSKLLVPNTTTITSCQMVVTAGSGGGGGGIPSVSATTTATNNKLTDLLPPLTSQSPTLNSSAYKTQESLSNPQHRQQVLMHNQLSTGSIDSESNRQQSSSDILLESKIDAVDDDLLVSVAAGDPNVDFPTDLNDLNLLLEEMESSSLTTATTSSSLVATTTIATTTTITANQTQSIMSNQTNANQQHHTILAMNPDPNNKSQNIPFFITHNQQHAIRSSSPLQSKMSLINNSSSNGAGQQQQSIMIQSNNNNVPVLPVTTTLPAQTTSGSIAMATTAAHNVGQFQQQLSNNSSVYTSPLQKSQQQLPISSIQQSLNESPRQIYVPARTQHSWRTVAAAAIATNTNTSQQPIPPAILTPSQPPPKVRTPTSLSPVGSEMLIHQQPSSPQTTSTRFISVNNNTNSGMSTPPPPSSSPLIRQQTINSSSNPVIAKPQQILIRTGGGPGQAFSISQQQQSSMTNAVGSSSSNAVALSSPLLVNLLQNDVPVVSCSSSSSNSTSFQQQITTAVATGGGNENVNSQQQQIRLLSSTPHHRHYHQNSGDSNTAASLGQVTHQLMMVQVSSAGAGQATTTTIHQISNPVAGNVVHHPTMAVSSTSTKQQQQQSTIDQSQSNADNNGTTTPTTPLAKPKKQRKSRKKANQSTETTLTTDCSSSSSLPSTPTTPSNQFTPSGGISICQPPTTDLSARIQSNSGTTFLTIPANAQLIQQQKLQQQQPQTSNSANQSTLMLNQQASQQSLRFHHQKPRLMMIATNPAAHHQMVNAATGASDQMAAVSSVTTMGNPTIVSSPSGGTFIIANVPASSLQNAVTSSATGASMMTAASPSTVSPGVQLGGNRKQIFLATKSNSFPVSSALSAGAIVRFANQSLVNSGGGASSSSSSTPNLVPSTSQTVKLVSSSSQQTINQSNQNFQQPNQQQSTTTIQQQQQLLNTVSAVANTSPNKSSQHTLLSTSTTPTLVHQSNTMQLSQSISIPTSNTNTSNNNSFSVNQPTSATIATTISIASPSSSSSPIRATKSLHQQSEQQLLLTPVVASTMASSSSTSVANIIPQQFHKTFQVQATGSVSKNNPSSLLLNKLSQRQHSATVNPPMCTKIALPTAVTVSSCVSSPGTMMATKVPFHAKVSVTADIPTKSEESVLDNATFVVKNQEVPLVLVDQQKSAAVSAPTTTFTKTTSSDQSSALQQKTEMVMTGNKQQSQVNFKQSLSKMLSGNVEGNGGNEEQQSRTPPDSVFLDDSGVGRMSAVSESSAPISPSYFLAPASAFDRSTKDPLNSTIQHDDYTRIDCKSTTDSKIEEKTNVDGKKSDVIITTSTKNKAESSMVTTTAAIFPSSTTTTSGSTSMMKTLVDTSSAISSQRSNSFYVIKHDYSQELPDHILDDDEEDGEDDSDADDYGFYSSRPSHFLSGSIGSIGGGGGSSNSASVSKSSMPTNDFNQNSKKNLSSESDQLEKAPGNVAKKLSTSDSLTTKSIQESNQEVISSIKTDSQLTTKQSSSVEEKQEEQQKCQQQESAMTLIINGDISSQESPSTSIDSDIEKPLIKQSAQSPAVSLSTTVPSSIASKSHPLATTVTNFTTNESFQTKDSTNTTSSVVLDELDEPKVFKPQTSLPSSLKPEISNSSTFTKNQQISSSSNKHLASKSTATTAKFRRKTSSPLSDVSSSLLTPSSKDSTLLISSNSNLETSHGAPSPNKKQQPQQQPVLVHFKHPTSQTLSTGSTIQLANTMNTFLTAPQTSSATNADNNISSVVPTTTATMLTTTVPSSPNQKIRVVYNSPLYRTVLPTSTGGQQQQFPQIQLLSIKQSPSSSATPTSFKLISNKLPMVGQQGSSQPLLIPMAVSNNQGTVFSVKAPTSSAAIAATTIAQSTTTTIVTSDYLQGISNNKQIPSAEQRTQSFSDAMNSSNLKTIDSETLKNEESIEKKSDDIINSSDNSVESTKMTDSISTEDPIRSNVNEKTKESVSAHQSSKEELESKLTPTQQIMDTTMMKSTLLQTDNPSTTNTKLAIQPQTSVARTVIMLPSGSDSIAGSNVVILKAESPLLSKADNTTTTTTSNSLSNSPLRRQILISKPATLHHHHYNSNQDLTSNTTTTQQQGSIYATKSSTNNSKTVTATKTLPSILRQRKRKNDTLSQQQVFHTSSISTITIDSVKSSSSSAEQTAAVTTNDCSVLLSSESDDPESHSTPNVQHGSLSFKQQKYQSILSTSKMNDDIGIDSANVSDQTDSSTHTAAATRPLKRARKTKITTIPQQHIGSMALPTVSPVYVNFVTNPCSDLPTSESGQDDKNETAPTVTNSRILRNSTTLTVQPNTQPTPKTIVKRGQRNQRASSIQMTESTNDSISLFTTTSVDTINESIKLNEKPKRAAVGNTSTTTNRQTRSNRGRKKPTESSTSNQTMNNATTLINSSDHVSETFVTDDTINVDQQQPQSLINQNLIGKSLNSSSTMLTHNNSSATTLSVISNNPTITHPISVISVSNVGEPLVSLLDSSNNVNTVAGNNPVTSGGNNNSLLVKRSRKTLLTAVTSSTTTTIHPRPSLRNSSASETISPPPPSAKRRRLAKDVSK